MAKEKAKIKQYTRPTDHLFMTIVYAFCAIALIAILIPLIFVVAASFSSPDALLSAKVFLWPVDFTLRGYKMVFDHDLLPLSFWNSIVYTVVGTVINLVLTVLAAYPLSRKDLAVRNPIMMLFAFTMLFNGGMIPTYLLVRDLGMLDTMWAILLPTAISYFQTSIPQEILESASIDGCNDFQFLIKMVIPLSVPILAVNVLLYAVGHWNSYFNEMIYLSTNTKYPLQLILRDILLNDQSAGTMDVTQQLERQKTQYLLQYSSMVVGTVPLMLLYPAVQKYSIKGIMVGAVKG